MRTGTLEDLNKSVATVNDIIVTQEAQIKKLVSALTDITDFVEDYHYSIDTSSLIESARKAIKETKRRSGS